MLAIEWTTVALIALAGILGLYLLYALLFVVIFRKLWKNF